MKTSANGNAKEQSSSNHSMKRPREISPVETKYDMPSKMRSYAATNGSLKQETVKKEPVTPSTHTNDAMDYNDFHDDDDMDFSMLEDEENQFSQDIADTSMTNGTTIKTETIISDSIKKEPTKTEPTKTDKRDAEQVKADLIKKENENYAKLLSNWESNFTNEKDDDDELLGSIDVDAAQTAITSSVDGKSTMKFWYWDAFEDPIKLPGKIFLFGKMASAENPKEFKSVCITVEKVNRCLYLLPRQYVCGIH